MPTAARSDENFWPNWILRIAKVLRLRRRQKPAIGAATQPSSTKPAEGPENRPRFSESLEPRQMLSAAVAPLSFAPAVFYQDTPAQSVAVGVFTPNGLPDIVATHEQDSRISVLINEGNGTFLPAEHYYCFDARAVAVGDFNGDGNEDLAVLSANGTSSQIDFFYGNGNGQFAKPSVKINLDYQVTAIATANFSGSGPPDLVITTAERVIVLLNDGNGAFAKPVNYHAGAQNSGDLVVGDFNGDGVPDVAVVRRGVDGIDVLLGNSNGTLGLPLFYKTGSNPRAIVAGDFNGDGKLDLAIANSDFRQPGLDILYGNGDGTFSQTQGYFGGNFVDGVAVGDFTGNGIEDIATVSFSSDLRVYAGNGDGTFQPFVDYPSAPYGQYVVAADFNGDGKDDIAVGTGAGVKVLLSTSGNLQPPPPTTSLNVTIGAGGTKSLTYQDVSGAAVTISLTGPGSATVNLAGANLSANGNGSVSGGDASITSIAATGTTAASVLSITPKGNNGLVNVGAISTDGSFGSIVAPKANLLANITAAGTIGAIQFRDVSGGTITLGAGGVPLSVSFRNVNNENLLSDQPIANLSVGQWYSSAGATQISAPSIGKIDSAGVFQPNLVVGSGGINSFIARGVSGGDWTVSGAVTSVRVLLDAQFDLSAFSIGTLSIQNTLNDSTISTTGNIGSISAGAMTNSAVYAATSLPTGQTLPDSAADFTGAATIGSIALRQYASVATFVNSEIAAPTLGRLDLGTIDFSNGGTPFGLAAESIGQVSGLDLATVKSFSIAHPLSTERLIARGINPQDFALEIV